jgi:hypothetical protein
VKRRDWLIGAGIAAGSVGLSGALTLFERSRMQHVAAWHLWGSKSVVTVESTFTTPVVVSNQLVNVKYKRPETWRFLFYAKLLASDPVAAGSGTIHNRFNLRVGVGRVNLALGTVIDLTFDPTDIGKIIFCSEIPDTLATPGKFGQFPAETIQLNCDSNYQSAVGTFNATIEVAAFMAPITHVRPDWFKGDFSSGELEGK